MSTLSNSNQCIISFKLSLEMESVRLNDVVTISRIYGENRMYIYVA